MVTLDRDRLETERLILRPPAEADALRLPVIINTRRIADMLGTVPHPYGIAQARRFLSNVAARRQGGAAFAITARRHGDQVIGLCGYGPSLVHGETDFGYWLATEQWGNGFATEAANAVLSHAFELAKVERLTTDHRKDNLASAGVLRKSGFRPVGERRRACLARHGHNDTVKLTQSREDWVDRHAAPVLRRSRTLPRLEGDGFHLRAIEAGDARRIAKFIGPYEVASMLAMVPHPYTLDDANDFIARSLQNAPGEANFAIATGEGLIGMVGFAFRELPVLGFWLGTPYWGRGIVTNAAGLAVAWLFRETAHDRIRSGVFIDNPASLRVQEKLGCIVTGRQMIRSQARGKDVEHINTALLKRHFQERAA